MFVKRVAPVICLYLTAGQDQRCYRQAASLTALIWEPGVRVVHSSILSLTERLLELRSQVSAEAVLERPYALTVGDAHPVAIV